MARYQPCNNNNNNNNIFKQKVELQLLVEVNVWRVYLLSLVILVMQKLVVMSLSTGMTDGLSVIKKVVVNCFIICVFYNAILAPRLR